MSATITTLALARTLRETGSAAVRLTPTCHPAAGVDLTYLGRAIMLVACHRCHDEVARLAVAGGQPHGREDGP